MPTATKTPAAKETRSVLIQRRNGQQQIIGNIPANAKITFGDLNPGKPGFNGTALRIYTTTNNQLATFTEVAWFRDLSLTVKTKQRQEKQNREAERGPKGSKVATQTEESFEWVDGETEEGPAQIGYPIPVAGF